MRLPTVIPATRTAGLVPAALRLDLTEARSFDCGIVVHIYRPSPI
jgi:hypothetical protein